MQDFSLYLPAILLAYSAFVFAILSPGPNMLAVMGTAMALGRRSGVALALGVACGSLSWGLLTLFGLSALLSAYASALLLIKILGGLYLLWLAYKAFRSAASTQDIEATALAGGQRRRFGYFRRGYLIQMTNPKAALAWIAIMSLAMQEGAPLWVGGLVVVGVFVISISLHLLFALAFSVPAMVRLYGSARRGVQALLGTFFTLAGLRLLLSRN